MDDSEPVREPEAEPQPRRRGRSRSPERTSHTRGTLRQLYFVLAALWGFVIGTAALLGGLAASGRPLRPEPFVGLVLLGAAVLALLGGIVAALAYREASNRSR